MRATIRDWLDILPERAGPAIWEEIAALRDAAALLIKSCAAALENSELLRLSWGEPELLQRVLSFCDARALGQFSATCTGNREPVELAVRRAIARQRSAGTVMPPLVSSAPSQLDWIERVREAAVDWTAMISANIEERGDTPLWPVNGAADFEAGAFVTAVLQVAHAGAESEEEETIVLNEASLLLQAQAALPYSVAPHSQPVRPQLRSDATRWFAEALAPSKRGWEALSEERRSDGVVECAMIADAVWQRPAVTKEDFLLRCDPRPRVGGRAYAYTSRSRRVPHSGRRRRVPHSGRRRRVPHGGRKA